jgi:hypothetical protein
VKIRIKICGFTTTTAVRAAGLAGVDAMGFVFAPSSRQVSLKLAAELLAEVPAGVERIAVFRRPDPALLFKVLELPIDTIQADASWFIETLIPEGFHLLPVVPDGSSLVSRIDSALHVVPIGRVAVGWPIGIGWAAVPIRERLFWQGACGPWTSLKRFVVLERSRLT